MDLAHVKGKPFLQEILAPVEDVHRDTFLRATALQAVQIEPGANSIAEIELLTVTDVASGTNQQADGSRRASVIVRAPRSSEIEASAELVVSWTIRHDGRV